MLSTELPITEWWDPEWEVYDVPLCPQRSLDPDPEVRIADTTAWWEAYDHVATIVHIATGHRWYGPDNLYAHQLTAGPALEPPRRPPSWYPGQPEPPKPRRRACTCFYGLRTICEGAERGPLVYVTAPGAGWYGVRVFVIVFDCPHHGDDRYDPELLKGFTPAGEALFWETLDETERHD